MKRIHQIEPLGISRELQEYYYKLAEKQGFKVKYWDDRPQTPEEIISRCQGAEYVILSSIPITREILDQLPELKMLSVAFTGLDHIDMETCRQREIMVKNAAGYSTHSVAELTIAMILSLYRSIVFNAMHTLNGGGRDGYTGYELRGKTVGIIGAGRIGQETARLCRAFGCNTIAWSRTVKKVPGLRFVSLETLLSQADIVTLHVPLTAETRGLLNRERLALIKPSAILINTARGPVIDTEALCDALNTGAIAGAALDVYDMEPPLPSDYPLFKAKNVLLLPHIAYATHEAFELRAKIVYDNIFSYQPFKI